MKNHRTATRTALWLLGAASLLALAACDRTDTVVNRPAMDNAPVVAVAPIASTDSEITSLVEGSLTRDEQLRSQDIDVDTTNGEVRLRGEVDNQAQKDHALMVARTVAGVRGIQDELTLKR